MGTSWGMWHEPCTHPAAPLVSRGWRKVLGCLQPCPGWEGLAEASVSAGLSPSQFLQPGVILPSEPSARFLLEIGSGCGSGGCGRQLSQKEKGDGDSKGSGLGGASLPAPLAGAPGEEVSPLLSGLSLPLGCARVGAGLFLPFVRALVTRGPCSCWETAGGKAGWAPGRARVSSSERRHHCPGCCGMLLLREHPEPLFPIPMPWVMPARSTCPPRPGEDGTRGLAGSPVPRFGLALNGKAACESDAWRTLASCCLM